MGQLIQHQNKKNEEVELRIKYSDLLQYSPHLPWRKQRLFLDLTVKEALYGGAAGGGKSDALLMGALQYVHVPGYAALILRKDSQRLRLSGGLIPRSHEWLYGKAEWNGTDKRWRFKNGASIQFGYLDSANDKYRYGSSEYQYIGFDELTEFTEEDYLFLFSRLRMTLGIEACGVPYRIRGASNPGGPGHEWVKNRFISRQAEEDLRNNNLQEVYEVADPKHNTTRVFVPAKVRDNPAVNPETYIENLMHLSPVVRERLMNGDWTVMPTGLIKEEWLRYYTMRGNLIDLLISRKDTDGNMLHTEEVLHSFHENECRRFITIDTAGGMKDITAATKKGTHSWTVIGVWDHKRFGTNQALVLKYIYRDRVGFMDIANQLRKMYVIWKPHSIRVEDKTMGPDLENMLRHELPISLIASGTIDKVSRATTAMNMFERGQIYLPRDEGTWRHTYEGELLSWQGLEDETNDQIDMTSYAAIEANGSLFGGTVQLAVDPRKPTEMGSGKSFKTGEWIAGSVKW